MKDKVHAIYPGSFDPMTLGHVDIIERASKLFDRVTVAIGRNPNKSGLLSIEQRLKLAKGVCKTFSNVDVEVYDGLTVDFAKRLKCHVMIRGLRDSQDFGFELQLAHMNRSLHSKLETIFIPTAQALSAISSTLVRDIALNGGDVTKFVSPSVARALADVKR
jgi:pantetheine-phosphate adenylyltransferase